MQRHLRFERKTLIKVLAVLAVLLAWAAAKGSLPVALGLIFGTFTSVIYFRILIARINRAADMSAAAAVACMRGGWLLRLTLVVAVTLISLQVPFLNVFATLTGLVLTQIIILADIVAAFLKRPTA